MITRYVDGQKKELTRVQYCIEEGGELVLKTLSVIRYGSRIIWQGIRSCFGSGVWRSDKPWLNGDVWKN